MTHTKYYQYVLLGLLLLLFLPALPAQDAPSAFSLRGYVKDMGGMQLNKNFADPQYDNIFHNRLNFSWIIIDNFSFVAEGRNRLFYNPLFEDFPFFADQLETDQGWADLSWVWMSEGAWLGHTMLDRLYLDYRIGDWQVRAGRQRINWGINMVSNPNDLFNTYSFFDVDYPERPGADAIRVQYHTGITSRMELAYSPASDPKRSTAAMLWANNFGGYDVQAIAGYYRNRSALGAGWAGSIGGAGFKGELTWFYDIEEQDGNQHSDVVAATGLDYMLPNGTFSMIEFLYNGGYRAFSPMAMMREQPLAADNIMFSEYAVTLSLQHAFSPILSGNMAVMALPDQQSFFISPSVACSLGNNLDLDFLAQIFVGEKDALFAEAGSAWYLSLKYSF